MAAAQQLYAFVWAVLYAYWFEKSGSVLPSIVAHNVSNFVEDGLTFLVVWRWA
jgi:membrane protease YdiL (CAAX protease family)